MNDTIQRYLQSTAVGIVSKGEANGATYDVVLCIIDRSTGLGTVAFAGLDAKADDGHRALHQAVEVIAQILEPMCEAAGEEHDDEDDEDEDVPAGTVH